MATGRRVSGGPGTGFVNFGDWVAANSAGGQRLADELAQGAETAGTNAQNALGALEDEFNIRVRQGGYGYNEPGANYSHALELSRRGYTGPNALSDLAGYEDAMSQAQRAGEGARALDNLYGRATALQDVYGKGRDYSGQQALMDSALAGASSGGRFGQLNQQWGGLLGKAQAKEKDASAHAKEVRASTNAAQEQYAALAPKLKVEEERARNAANDAASRQVHDQQDEWERRGGVAGGEGRGKRPGRYYSPLDEWGKGGAWG